jgi:REP element-mobilizing transposase RayT
MPTLKHLHIKAYPYMTTTVTINRAPVFEESEAADVVLEAIFFGKRQQWYYLLSFVIMPDHMHLIIIPRDKDISKCMKSIKGFSARQINEVFSRKGSLWQSGFYDYILDSEDKVLSRIKYIEENPVRKGMVGCPEEYRYSSIIYRAETDFGIFF